MLSEFFDNLPLIFDNLYKLVDWFNTPISIKLPNIENGEVNGFTHIYTSPFGLITTSLFVFIVIVFFCKIIKMILDAVPVA